MKGLMMYIKNIIPIILYLLVLVLLPGCDNSSVGTGGSNKSVSGSRKLITVTKNYADSAIDSAGQSMQAHHSVEIAPQGSGVAYMDQYNGQGRVIHNDSYGKFHRVVGDVAISPDGTKTAYMASDDDYFKRIVSSGSEGPLSLELGEPKFSPDSKHLLYTVSEKDPQSSKQHNYLVIDHKVNRKLDIAQDFVVSPDSRWVALISNPSVNELPTFIISDLTLNDRVLFPGCGDSYSANSDKTLIAVACRDGQKKYVKVIDFMKRTDVSSGKPHTAGTIMRLKFAADNRSLAYTYFDAQNSAKRYIVSNDKEERIPAGDEIMSDPLVLSGNGGVIAAIGTAYAARIYRAFSGSGKEGKTYSFIDSLVGSADLKQYAYTAGNPKVDGGHILVVNGTEGPAYDRIVSPFFTPDGQYVVCRARKNGKRFVVVTDLNAKVVAKHKEYDMVFQPVVSRDGKTLEYGVLDGKDFWWIVEKLR